MRFKSIGIGGCSPNFQDSKRLALLSVVAAHPGGVVCSLCGAASNAVWCFTFRVLFVSLMNLIFGCILSMVSPWFLYDCCMLYWLWRLCQLASTKFMWTLWSVWRWRQLKMVDAVLGTWLPMWLCYTAEIWGTENVTNTENAMEMWRILSN